MCNVGHRNNECIRFTFSVYLHLGIIASDTACCTTPCRYHGELFPFSLSLSLSLSVRLVASLSLDEHLNTIYYTCIVRTRSLPFD